MNVKSTNLRRQRVQERKDQLVDAADAQFRHYGYDDTTLESIADAASTHVQTLYRHFPKKQDLLLALLKKNLDEFEAFMGKREHDALSAWRNWVQLNAERSVNSSTFGSPPITGMSEYWHRYEAALAREIARDMDVNPTVDLRPMLAACMLVGTNKHAAADMFASGQTHNWVADLLRVVDTAVETFGATLIDSPTSVK